MHFHRCGLCVLLVLGGITANAREWTDATGAFKVQAELVAVRNGKAILEKADGSVLSVPVDKLSAADQAYLKSLDKPQPSPRPATPPPLPAAPTPAATLPTAPPAPLTAQAADQAHKVEAILKANCYRCLGEDGACEGASH